MAITFTGINYSVYMKFKNLLVLVVLVAQSCPTLIAWTVARQAPLSIEFSRQEY